MPSGLRRCQLAESPGAGRAVLPSHPSSKERCLDGAQFVAEEPAAKAIDRATRQELVANVYQQGEGVPTLSEVLRDPNNDVIVTVGSQWAGSSISYPVGGNLEHTSTPNAGAFASLIPGLSDNDVLHSESVDNLILFNLQNCCAQ